VTMVVVFFGFQTLQEKTALDEFAATVEQQFMSLKDSVQRVDSRNSRMMDMLEQQQSQLLRLPGASKPARQASMQGKQSADRACQGDPADCIPYKSKTGQKSPVLRKPAKAAGKTANVHGLLHGLADAGFAIFSKEPNTLACLGECIEYSFLRLNLNPASDFRMGPKAHPSTSLSESFGFFDDDDVEWARKKVIHNAQMARQVQQRNYNEKTGGHAYFQGNWEPSWHCAYMQRLGEKGDGGKWVCDPYKIAGNKDCKVISIGSKNQFDFEESILELNPHCEIHTFDHTVEDPSNKPPAVHFHPYGLGAVDEPPIYTWRTLMSKAGLKPGAVIEILKIDCEGCEFQVWNEIAKGPIRQVLMEVHWRAA